MPRKKETQDFSTKTSYAPILRKPLILKIVRELPKKSEPDIFYLIDEKNDNYFQYRIYLSINGGSFAQILTAGITELEQAFKMLSEASTKDGNLAEKEKNAHEIIRKCLIKRYRIGHIELSEKEINNIRDIEKKYDFSENFLLEEIYILDNSIAGIKNAAQQIPKDHQKKIYLKEVAKLVNNLLKLLSNNRFGKINILILDAHINLDVYLEYIQPKNHPWFYEVENKIDYFYNIIIGLPKHENFKQKININFLKKLIITTKKLKACLSRTGVGIIAELSNLRPVTGNEEKFFSMSLIHDLEDLKTRCNQILPATVSVGRPYDFVTKHTAIKLLDIYERGTSREAKIYNTQHSKDPYGSVFFEFTLDIFQIVKKLLPRNVKSNSLATAAHTGMIKEYKELKNMRAKSIRP